MFSGSVRGAAKPITIVALEVYPTIGSAPADLMMSRALINAGSSTGRIPDCNRTAAHSSVLDGGVHTRLLDEPRLPARGSGAAYANRVISAPVRPTTGPRRRSRSAR